MTTPVHPAGLGREEFAERLLKGSVKKSYAPIVDIDWYVSGLTAWIFVGQYHWQGAVLDHSPDDVVNQARAVRLGIGERNASARISEQTPQGIHSIAGVGAATFPLGKTAL